MRSGWLYFLVAGMCFILQCKPTNSGNQQNKSNTSSDFEANTNHVVPESVDFEADLDVPVLVVGGGCSGVAAAIQTARMGIKVLIMEPTPWLGGMISAAGVSATDGNHRLPSGLWGEFREKIYAHYGGAEAVATGWVSNTHFEPYIANQIWSELADAEPNLMRKHGYQIIDIIKAGNQVYGAIFVGTGGDTLSVRAAITIEATELGDVLPLAGAEFFTGQDRSDDPHNVHIQDLTFCAIIKDFGEGSDKTIPKPSDYDAARYDCFCAAICADTSKDPLDCETVLNYAELPNKKYLLNWPHDGNDTYLNPIPLSYQERKNAYVAAKNRTLGLLYYMQTELGWKHLGLAEDEFPTEDKLPFIPYHREARRVKGLLQLQVSDLQNPYENTERMPYQSAIAVGDYPLDHHHKENAAAQKEAFPAIPSFSVPYGCLVPEKIDGLLVAEKSISVSHDVNGATRLQPCVILIGQAAGAAAALCIENGWQPRDLYVRNLQEALLDAGCWLLPMLDSKPGDADFVFLHRVALSSILQLRGKPYKWANQSWLYPDSLAFLEDFWNSFTVEISPDDFSKQISDPPLQKEAVEIFYQKLKQTAFGEQMPDDLSPEAYFQKQRWIGEAYQANQTFTRKQLAIWQDSIWAPYDHLGVWVAPGRWN